MVNIYESAVKPVVDLEDQINVYVPGYSKIGPEEPTLCTSEAEFEGLFGSSPYTFESDQVISKIAAGSPEKGYLYAKALLAAGLNVYFHRYKVPGAKVAQVEIPISIKESAARSSTGYTLVAVAKSFGKGYEGIRVNLTKITGSLFNLAITDANGSKNYEGTVSLDPSSSLYIKTQNYSLVKFMAKETIGNKSQVAEIEDSRLMALIQKELEIANTPFELKASVSDSVEDEFYLDDVLYTATDTLPNGAKVGDVKIKGLLSSLADSSSEGMMSQLSDFEKFPSIAYITTGGYYINKSVAGNQLAMAAKISAIALIDLNLPVKGQADWLAAQAELASITGAFKNKGAWFTGCNSFDLSPYRMVLGDSFNYLTCLGKNVKSGTNAWAPVANDPEGVSPLGYGTTQKIDTALSETMAESKLGVQCNPIIYSSSAGGYKIMGNRTLVSNGGVLGPESFLNVAVVVNRVERACRQTANKLKIKSTSPRDTFNKFKASVSKTLAPMVVSQDGLISYKITKLKKTQAATIDIMVALTVVEGIETFNIYVPYSIALD